VTIGGRSLSAGALTSRLAAIAFGAPGAHACQAPTTASPTGLGHTRWKPVACGAGTVRSTSCVTAANLAATRSPQPPEQVLEAVLAAVDDPPVGEHRAHGDELVGGQAVRAAEDAEAAAQGQAGDPDPWPATRSDRAIVGSERVVDVGKAPRRRR
jgi:hypothetical protein